MRMTIRIAFIAIACAVQPAMPALAQQAVALEMVTRLDEPAKMNVGLGKPIVAWSPDGSALVASSARKDQVFVLDAATGGPIAEAAYSADAVAFGPTGSHVVLAGPTVLVLDLANWQAFGPIANERAFDAAIPAGVLRDVLFLPPAETRRDGVHAVGLDGSHLAIVSGPTFSLSAWQLIAEGSRTPASFDPSRPAEEAGAEQSHLPVIGSNAPTLTAVALIRGDAATSRDGYALQRLTLSPAMTPTGTRTLAGGCIRGGTISGDGSVFAALETPSRLCVFDLETGERVARHDFAQDVKAFTISADARYLAAVVGGRSIEIREPAVGAVAATADLGEPISGLAFSPGGNRLAVITSRGTTIWSVTPQ